MTEQEEKLNLLLFLNSVNISVLDSLEGEFFKLAKHKFKKIVNAANQFEKDVLRGCDELAQETYSIASVEVGSVLNEAIGAYNEGDLREFVEHCKNFKK